MQVSSRPPPVSYIYGDPASRPGSGLRSSQVLAAQAADDMFTDRPRFRPAFLPIDDDESSTSTAIPQECVCPNCMTTVKKLYVLTDIEDVAIERSLEPLELLSDRDQVHYLRAHVTKLELLLKESSDRLSSLNLRTIESTRTDLVRDVIQLPTPPGVTRPPRRAHDWDLQ